MNIYHQSVQCNQSNYLGHNGKKSTVPDNSTDWFEIPGLSWDFVDPVDMEQFEESDLLIIN